VSGPATSQQANSYSRLFNYAFLERIVVGNLELVLAFDTISCLSLGSGPYLPSKLGFQCL
jgi:hypothetical protein